MQCNPLGELRGTEEILLLFKGKVEPVGESIDKFTKFVAQIPIRFFFLWIAFGDEPCKFPETFILNCVRGIWPEVTPSHGDIRVNYQISAMVKEMRVLQNFCFLVTFNVAYSNNFFRWIWYFFRQLVILWLAHVFHRTIFINQVQASAQRYNFAFYCQRKSCHRSSG